MNYPAIPRDFFNGDCFDAYRILGAHPCSDTGTEGWRFAVWAPGATAVEVCGGFDGWEAGVPMEKADTGVWSAFIPGLAEGDLYKYRVHGADGRRRLRDRRCCASCAFPCERYAVGGAWWCGRHGCHFGPQRRSGD